MAGPVECLAPAAWRTGYAPGFALPSAIFLLVVLAGLAAFMLSVFTTSQSAQTLDLNGARAFQAARAGLEWGAYQVLDPRNETIGTPASCASPVADLVDFNPATPATPGFPVCPGAAFPGATAFAGSELAGAAVTVSCLATDHREAGRNIRVYQLAARANVDAGTSFAAERLLRLRVALCRDPSGDPAAQPPCGCL
jgi:MSHA biogenesis protein MshP